MQSVSGTRQRSGYSRVGTSTGHSFLVLNLGCGTKTSPRPEVINIDWSIYLRLRQGRLTKRLAPLVLRGSRLEHFRSLPERIVARDLSMSYTILT
jgi:hypothetical protein